jgi:hypothetical protein
MDPSTSPLVGLYAAVEALDGGALRDCLTADAFVLAPEAAGVLLPAATVVADMGRRLDSLRGRGASLRIRNLGSLARTTASGEGGWVFDRLAVEVAMQGEPPRAVPARVTAALVHDEGGWRVAAGYWSVPFDTQDGQDAVKHAGLLEPGEVLAESIGAVRARSSCS